MHQSLANTNLFGLSNFQVDPPKKHIMKAALKNGVASGTLIQVKSSYKLSADAKKVATKKPKAPAAAKKVAAKKKVRD